MRKVDIKAALKISPNASCFVTVIPALISRLQSFPGFSTFHSPRLDLRRGAGVAHGQLFTPSPASHLPLVEQLPS